jgi:DNA-binding IclR family transcriptional regulator
VSRARFIIGLIDFQMRPVTLREIADACDTSPADARRTVETMVDAGLVRLSGDQVSFPNFVRQAA